MAVSRKRLQWCRRQPKHNLALESREVREKGFGKGRCCWESMKRKSRQRGNNSLIWQRRQAGFEYATLTLLCEIKGLTQRRCCVPLAVCSFLWLIYQSAGPSPNNFLMVVQVGVQIRKGHWWMSFIITHLTKCNWHSFCSASLWWTSSHRTVLTLIPRQRHVTRTGVVQVWELISPANENLLLNSDPSASMNGADSSRLAANLAPRGTFPSLWERLLCRKTRALLCWQALQTRETWLTSRSSGL